MGNDLTLARHELHPLVLPVHLILKAREQQVRLRILLQKNVALLVEHVARFLQGLDLAEFLQEIFVHLSEFGVRFHGVPLHLRPNGGLRWYGRRVTFLATPVCCSVTLRRATGPRGLASCLRPHGLASCLRLGRCRGKLRGGERVLLLANDRTLFDDVAQVIHVPFPILVHVHEARLPRLDGLLKIAHFLLQSLAIDFVVLIRQLDRDFIEALRVLLVGLRKDVLLFVLLLFALGVGGEKAAVNFQVALSVQFWGQLCGLGGAPFHTT